jgi:hypothetical protein
MSFDLKKKKNRLTGGRLQTRMERNEGENMKRERDALFLLLRISLQPNQKTSHVYHFFTCQ